MTPTETGTSDYKFIDQDRDRPFHKHTCPDTGHVWECNSPYCNSGGIRVCPPHGGREPVSTGYEPWRG